MSPKNRSIIYRKTTSTVTTSPVPPSSEPTTSPIPVERAYSPTPTPTSPFPSTVDRYRPKERQIPISTINEEEEGQDEVKIERSFTYEKVYEDNGRSSKREIYKTTETSPKKYGLTAKSISISPSPTPTNGYTNGYTNGTKTPEKTYTTMITTTIEKKEPKRESQQISVRLGDDYPNSSMSRMSIKSRHDEEWKNFLREAREFLGVTDDRDFNKLEREEEIVEEMVEEVGPRTEGRTVQEMTEYRKESSPSPSWTRTVTQKMEKKTMY